MDKKAKDKKSKINNNKVLMVIISILIVIIIIILLLSRTKEYNLSVAIDNGKLDYLYSVGEDLSDMPKLYYTSASGIATVGFWKSTMSMATEFSLEPERQNDFYYEIRIGKDNSCIRGYGNTSISWHEKNFYNGAVIKKLVRNKDNAYFCYIENYNKENQVDHCFKIMLEEVN